MSKGASFLQEGKAMKLILAIINHDDANTVTQALTKKGFSSTKLATTT